MNDALNALYVRLRDEPVALAALVGALLVLLVQFGIPVPDKLDDALTGVILALSVLVARRKVIPARKLDPSGEDEAPALDEYAVEDETV